MKKGRKRPLFTKRELSGYIFLLPVILGAVFIFIPAIANSLIYSFNNVTVEFSGIAKTFVGWQNYIDAFMVDTEFRLILVSATKGIVLDTVVIILFSFFISNVLNQQFKGRGIARMIFFMPVILTTGIVAKIEGANALYSTMEIATESSGSAFGQMGLRGFFNLEASLDGMGLPAFATGIVKGVVGNIQNIVNSSGVQIIIFISALQAINPSIFEASKMEGATKWEEFWKITFPLLLPNVLVCVVYTIIDTFTNPIYGVVDYIQSQAFNSGKMGYAAALSWIYFVIVLVFLGISASIISRRITYID